MWKFDNLLATIDDGVVTISINREEKLNALNIATVPLWKNCVVLFKTFMIRRR